MTIRRLLAITHEASNTGAPILLASFLEWIRDNTGTEIHTVVMADGAMLGRFQSLGEVTVLDRSALATAALLAERGLGALGSRRLAPALAALRVRPQTRSLGDFDLVYVNSFTSIEVLPHLQVAAPVVAHIHELPFAVRSYPYPERLDILRDVPQAWIAVCGEVKTMLADLIGAPAHLVQVHHPFVDSALVGSGGSRNALVRLRKRIGIPAQAKVVVGSGTTDWRKGPELFVQLATEIRRRTDERVHFVWVGGDTAGPNWERIRSDLERSGAVDVHFVGAQADPFPWFALADVFALTSHEDPFPLVVQEHALMGHPVVTYRNGGIVELLEAAGPEAALGVVDHLDVGALADAAIRYLTSDPLRAEAGRQLRDQVRAHHDRPTSAARLYEALERVVDETPATIRHDRTVAKRVADSQR